MSDTIDTPTTEPTADEIAGAQAIFARLQAAQAAKRAAFAPKVLALVGLEGFDAILIEATALRAEAGEGHPSYDHLNAAVIGMENLKRDAAVATPALAAPTPSVA